MSPPVNVRSSVVVVSGLPRSGTSMMMRMVEAGGIVPLSDEVRTADPDNPYGYYEYEPVKGLAADNTWLPNARGRALKVVSALLEHLPADSTYRVIFMHRDMQEILASQRAMLERSGKTTDPATETRLARLFADHVERIRERSCQRAEFSWLDIEHRAALSDAVGTAARVNAFLGGELNTAAMASAVDKKLYRQRSAS